LNRVRITDEDPETRSALPVTRLSIAVRSVPVQLFTTGQVPPVDAGKSAT
jgi:hypothetical protein